MSANLFFGIMTGTSADGIDVVLASISNSFFKILDAESISFPEAFKAEIKSLCSPSQNELYRAYALGIEISLLSAKIVNTIIARQPFAPNDITAIGYHGQTIRHHPDTNPAFSIQIGCPSTLAHHTQIKTITDFRMADIAAGGQGAPLVPAFHDSAFRTQDENRLILNIGGIANISMLAADVHKETFGFDTGPGNTLLDEWISKHQNKDYDDKGDWARSGNVSTELLTKMMSDSYIRKTPPKSTGKEYFNLSWLSKNLNSVEALKPEDIQRTLLEFTCKSITHCIDSIIESLNTTIPITLFVCGGGIKNNFMMERLSALMPSISIKSTTELDLHPQLVEASAFAWLACRTHSSLHGNMRSATGASKNKILGGIYPP